MYGVLGVKPNATQEELKKILQETGPEEPL
jgi:curved DNA-binding protein CbpA